MEYQEKPSRVMRIYKECEIKPELLAGIINTITEQVEYFEIEISDFKTAIIDLCYLYGGVIYSDFETKQYSTEMLDGLNRQARRYIDLCLADFKLDISVVTNRPNNFNVLTIEVGKGISPELLSIIIDEIFTQYLCDNITAFAARNAIIDLCHLYGTILFENIETRNYTKEIVDCLCEEVLNYIGICLSGYHLSTYDGYIDEDEYCESILEMRRDILLEVNDY